MAVSDGQWPPGKMYVRMKSECELQYCSYRLSGSVITWMTARPPGLSERETTPKKEVRCSCPTASSISIETTLSNWPCGTLEPALPMSR